MPAEEVPQGNVDGGAAAVLRACAGGSDEALEGARVPFDSAGVLAKQVGGSRLVHPSGHGARPKESLADTGQSVVCTDGDVTEVRVFPQSQGRHARDPHGPPCTGASWHMSRIIN